MAGFTGLGDPSMLYPGMGGMSQLMFQNNEALLSQLLATHKPQFHPSQQNWNALNNKGVPQYWMNADYKVSFVTSLYISI